eukprot:TRINITY_DN1812_c0_g3_i1.p1 TRINITY_DN1812_c0_g3~~TRINITY_DN1812_c0_g3_i1.p1  ORF type:complete len:726 (+),score=254.94 TRINITY_DN1812_c0_g3_i1:197-2179(+)
MKTASRMPVIRSSVPLPTDTLPEEEDFGIVEFLDKENRKPFNAFFKQRYTDFMVREILQDGTVVRLTNNSSLPEFDIKQLEEKQKVYSEAESVSVFTALLGEEQAKVLAKFSALEAGEEERQHRLAISIENEDKEKRTEFHANLKKYHPHLRSETKVEGEVRTLEVFHPGKRQRERQWNDWPKDKPDFLVFTLYKENKETTAVLELIAKTIKVKSNVFDVAGTKDKRAVTSQRVTAYKVPAQKLIDASQRLWGLKTGDYGYTTEALKLGDLKGNHFTIVLRYVDSDEETLIKACESIKQNGFINYYGTQRFGTGTISTHTVGKELLLSHWEEAIDLILKPRAFEKNDSLRARMHWASTGDIDGTLDLMPYCHVIERKLLIAMKANGKTLNSFSALPSNMRLMYVHAYQSYIWNFVASKRVAMQTTLEPMVGDLVLDKEGNAMHVTEENKSEFTIQDVVLPLPGHSILYPKNELYDFMKEIMAKDGLDIQEMERKQFLFSLPGGYRNLIEKAQDFTYSIRKFTEYSDQLALTDADILEGKTLPETQGQHTALVIEMGLGSGSYATMLIRELTKTSTSQKHQRELQEALEKAGIVPPSKDWGGNNDAVEAIEGGQTEEKEEAKTEAMDEEKQESPEETKEEVKEETKEVKEEVKEEAKEVVV